MSLILGPNGTVMLKWWINVSHEAHLNIRDYAEGTVCMGRGLPISDSTNQKSKTRISTELKIVGVDEFMPGILWARNVLKDQHYGVTENIIFQNNRSALLLENNSKASIVNRKKHINIIIFATGRIQKGEISVEWCPTNYMNGDLFTNPNPGSLLWRFRDLIMGVVVQLDPGLGNPNNFH